MNIFYELLTVETQALSFLLIFVFFSSFGNNSKKRHEDYKPLHWLSRLLNWSYHLVERTSDGRSGLHSSGSPWAGNPRGPGLCRREMPAQPRSLAKLRSWDRIPLTMGLTLLVLTVKVFSHQGRMFYQKVKCSQTHLIRYEGNWMKLHGLCYEGQTK